MTTETATTFTQLIKQNENETDNQKAITLSVVAAPSTTTKDDEGWEHYAWIVRLMYQGRTLDLPYKCGTAHIENERKVREYFVKPIPKPPTVADVLYSLVSDSSMFFNASDFEEWAGDLGYDTDSRKAERIYAECGKQAKELQQFLGVPTFEAFMNAEMDY